MQRALHPLKSVLGANCFTTGLNRLALRLELVKARFQLRKLGNLDLGLTSHEVEGLTRQASREGERPRSQNRSIGPGLVMNTNWTQKWTKISN